MTIPSPYLNSDKKSFAAESCLVRWPKILTGAIDDVHRTVMELDSEKESEKIEEGKSIISSVTKLKHELGKNAKLTPLEGSDRAIKEYNDALEALPEGQKSWLGAPWLYSECYMYQRLSTYFKNTKHWTSYDVFLRQKTETFHKSAGGVGELAARYQRLAGELKDISPDVLQILFNEFVDISLWGNATDLSLLTSISLEDIQSLQGAAARKKNEKNILVNDTDDIWKTISGTSGGRIDFVLDNSGFELLTDLAFALFLLDSKLADHVVLHPKNIPWFVSDVLPKDFDYLVAQLQQPGFFPDDHRESLDYLAERLIEYHSNNKLTIKTSDFWTSYCPFWEIKAGGINGGSEVHEFLKASKLVFYKGDLNHRKILGDVEWPRDTKFTTAIQSMADAGVKFATLRTIKADVVAGLPTGREEALEKEWLALGNDNKYGWAWSGKYAVIEYSSGQK